MSDRFRIPTPSEVREYGLSIGYRINGDKFCAYYEMKGWMVGKAPMKSWKAAVKLWKINSNENQIMAPTPKESDADRKKRLLNSMQCVSCYGGKLYKTDENEIRCNQCSGNYTKEILKLEGKVYG